MDVCRTYLGWIDRVNARCNSVADRIILGDSLFEVGLWSRQWRGAEAVLLVHKEQDKIVKSGIETKEKKKKRQEKEGVPVETGL